MAKIQTITFKKADSNWTSSNECYSELTTDVSNTEWVEKYSSIIPNIKAVKEVSFDVTTQTMIETRTWNNDDDFINHQSSLSEISVGLETKLQQIGWTITETIDNA